jgi:hypothetical protein
MLKIRRSASYRIITRALNLDGRPLAALLSPGADDCQPCVDIDQLQAGLQARHNSIIVYNQQAEVRVLVDKLKLPARQIFIEIRQDTRAMLGLHALRRHGTSVETLDRTYQ